jgi:CheY-like chemotaxis protein
MANELEKEGGKILVVDDNLLNRKLACAILNSCKFEYDVAENGKIAFEKFKSGKYKLILMDIQMPIMNGIDCTMNIRKAESEMNADMKVPIIAVTTFSHQSDKENCMNAGMNDLLAKPYKTSDLVNMISKYIDLPHNPTL